jgi:hypothetical protein
MGAVDRLAHLLVCRLPMPVFLVAVFGLGAVVVFVGPPAGQVLIVGLLAYFVLSMWRVRRLCVHCAAGLPLAAAALAEAQRRKLRLFHWVAVSRWRVALLAVGPMLALVALRQVVGLSLLATGLGMVVALMPLAVADQAAVVHQRVQPWCPWCHGGGGGGERSPDPAPDPVIRQPA